MGRPRKLDKMTRVVTARVTDDQWDWLAERAIELHDGDLSKAVRDGLLLGQVMVDILSARDPAAALSEFLRRSEEEQGRRFELRMDSPGGRMRIERAIDAFLDWRRLERDATPRSVESYRRILLETRGGLPRGGDRLPNDGRSEAFLESLDRSESAATRANVISVLHSFFAWARSRGPHRRRSITEDQTAAEAEAGRVPAES